MMLLEPADEGAPRRAEMPVDWMSWSVPSSLVVAELLRHF